MPTNADAMAKAKLMDATIAKYSTMAVPRYTSYPTVPHFSDAVSAGDYAGWLANLNPSEPLSLYLHVPFCRQLCWYCGCNMKLASRDEPVAKYAATLMQEIELLASKLPARMTLSHLHWGGGTPTSLTPGDLAQAMDTVRRNFDFTPDAEIALESDPRTLSEHMIERIGALGFTRASFGVQEFDPKVQKAINRIQPPEMVARAVDGLRAAGVSDINFDLIYGLPFQTKDTLVATIQACAAMHPDRLALFGYAHVPWMAKKQRLIPEAALPGASERLQQAKAAADTLRELGYDSIGLDHFALPTDPLAKAARKGELRRNFQGYTTDRAQTLLGVGATSIGRTPQGYVQNISETGAWARAVEAGVLPVAKGHALRGEDAVRSCIIENLMCFGEVDIDAVRDAFPMMGDGFTNELAHLAHYAADGIVTIDGGKVRIADGARSLVRVIASVFDEYHHARRANHSMAV